MKYYNLQPQQRVNTLIEDDNESIVLRPKLRIIFGDNTLIILLCIIIPIVLYSIPNSYLRVALLCIGIISVSFIIYSLYKLKQTSWVITSSQLIYKRGVFSISTDYMELYRINDFTEKQRFIDRLLGLKTITVHSTDASNRTLILFGIENSIEVVPHIRRNVELSKNNRNVYEITNR